MSKENNIEDNLEHLELAISPEEARRRLENQGFEEGLWDNIVKEGFFGFEFGSHETKALIIIARGERLQVLGDVYKKLRMESKESQPKTPEEIAKRKVEKALKLSREDEEGEVFLWSKSKYPKFFKGRLEKGENGSRKVVEEVEDLLDISEVEYRRDIIPNIGYEGGFHYMTFQPSKKYDNVYLAVEFAGDYGRNYGGKIAIVVTGSTKRYANQFRP